MVIEISFLLLIPHLNHEKISYNLKLFYCLEIFNFQIDLDLVEEIDFERTPIPDLKKKTSSSTLII